MRYVLLGLLALAGCDDGRQAKLEECMGAAERTNYFVHAAGKQARLDAEARCVKLYK